MGWRSRKTLAARQGGLSREGVDCVSQASTSNFKFSLFLLIPYFDSNFSIIFETLVGPSPIIVAKRLIEMSRAPPSKGTPSSLPLREYLELEMRAEMHLSKGDSKSALLLFERCLRHSESADGSANPPSARTAALLFTVGRCCFLSGDNLRAMGFLRRSAEATLGDILTRCDASLILCDAMMNCYQHSLAEIQCAVTFELLEQASAEGKLIASAAVCARRRARWRAVRRSERGTGRPRRARGGPGPEGSGRTLFGEERGRESSDGS